jgi:hypothetical protein
MNQKNCNTSLENFCPVNRIDEDIDARLHDQFVGRLARGDFETDDFVDEYNDVEIE